MQRAWLREFNALGMQLRPNAAKLIVNFLKSCEEKEQSQMCEALVEHTKGYFRAKQGVVSPIIDEEAIRNVISCMETASDEAADTADKNEASFGAASLAVTAKDLGDGVQVYNVMTDMRRFSYFQATKEWRHDTNGVKAFPGVNSKIQIYADRYHILWSRLLLSGEFVPEVEASGTSLLPGQRVITPVQSLVGNLGMKTTFGLISQTSQDDDGKQYWIIEDLHQAYPLEFVETCISSWDHQLICNGCFVIAQGEMLVDRFLVHNIELPQAVPRQMSQDRDQVPTQIFGGHLTEDQLKMLRGAEGDEKNQDGMYVVLSEVHLDDVKTLERLSDIFQGYEDSEPPTAYVFMGNFYSNPFLPTQEGVKNYREGFERLKLIMRHLPNHVERGTRFIFVPGPRDPGAEMLPKTPLTNYLTSDIAKEISGVVMATNPCRVRHFSREMVFFRHDVLKLVRRHEVVPLRTPEGMPVAQHVEDQMGKLLLDQGHLAPLPLQESNIMWDFDHCLRLYPLPDAVFVGGVSKPFEGNRKGCIFCSVGPFYREGAFHSYSPIKDGGFVEPCIAPDRA